MDRAITSVLQKGGARIPVPGARTLVAGAGTATTVQGISLGLPEYDPEVLHRSVLSRTDAERVFRLLADMTTEERRAIPSMAPGREDVIPAGAAILIAFMGRLGVQHHILVQTAVLDCLAYWAV